MKKMFFAMVVMLMILFILPMPISAYPDLGERGRNLLVYPGLAGGTTTIKIQAWNAEDTTVLLLVFKYDGTWEELLNIGNTDVEEVLQYLIYGTIPPEKKTGNEEGFFIVGDGTLENPWEVSINLALQAGRYFAVLVMGGGDEEIEPEFLVREFWIFSGQINNKMPWVRNVEMTCYQVWVNEKGNFEFVFWWEYRENNWVKIYDLAGNEVFSIDMPYGNARFEADLPDGIYKVFTFHDKPEPLQAFIIGK